MLGIKCFGYKKIAPLKKYKALWIGTTHKVWQQFRVSIKSYLKCPFVYKNKDATRKFFEKINSRVIVDDLIFDGNDTTYYKKTEDLVDTSLPFEIIYDCGCGNGSFLNFVRERKIDFNQYIGIDFAIRNRTNSDKIVFINKSVEEFEFNDLTERRLVVLCNLACYLSNDSLITLLKKIGKKGTYILIVEPVPGLFWDATFNHVKLYYRTPQKIIKLMKNNGFRLEKHSIDYLIKLHSKYFVPLSYAGWFGFQ